MPSESRKCVSRIQSHHTPGADDTRPHTSGGYIQIARNARERLREQRSASLHCKERATLITREWQGAGECCFGPLLLGRCFCVLVADYDRTLAVASVFSCRFFFGVRRAQTSSRVNIRTIRLTCPLVPTICSFFLAHLPTYTYFICGRSQKCSNRMLYVLLEL